MSDDEPPEEWTATSYEHYWWDCPACGGINSANDIQPNNEVLTCEDCGEKVTVS